VEVMCSKCVHIFNYSSMCVLSVGKGGGGVRFYDEELGEVQSRKILAVHSLPQYGVQEVLKI
jgi:hypothetical protein